MSKPRGMGGVAIDLDPKTAVVAIWLPGRPALLNAERSGHWSKRSRATAVVRTLAGYAANQITATGYRWPDPAEVASWPTYTDRRAWPDVGAWFPATKAAIDGLTDAAAWPDDNAAHVARLTFDAPRIGDDVGLWVEVRPMTTTPAAA